ncbi:MAG: aminotransferase class I/II-fold pyridoxal phosphate-dependent enzyme [Lachnospiraceae bacterium]|nr:aminotransferase class I/II-fold pyridoxal phosphate-dependent enzyme [Lachnospiraceae bacterium]
MKNNLLKNLKNYSNSDFYPFHMPGHKRNTDSGQIQSIYQYDITEIDDFDNLHQPEGIIDAAQKEAARLYHSEETYFLINGSTSGILSAISAVSEDGAWLLVARNCHRSVYHAAFLNRLHLCYMNPELIPEYDMAGQIEIESVRREIEHILSEEDAKIAGVVITSPTYDGISSDVKAIAELVHSYHIPLIVDQAHGAHFGFHPAYPESATVQGADIVIHSVHKTLPAPTQTAIIHKNGDLVDSIKLQKYLRIYQSSSPSYVLMAGIEEALRIVEEEGYQKLQKVSEWHQAVCGVAGKLKYLKVCPLTEPGKVIISVKGAGISGRQLYDIFREKYHLQMEMASGTYVTAILSMMDKEEGILRLIEAMKEIDAELSQLPKADATLPEKIEIGQTDFLPQKGMELWEAYVAFCEEIQLESLPQRMKKGQLLAAEFVNLYPPGIPLLVPGEVIDERVLQIIRQYLKNGYNVQGIDNNKIKVVILPEEGENYEKN